MSFWKIDLIVIFGGCVVTAMLSLCPYLCHCACCLTILSAVQHHMKGLTKRERKDGRTKFECD